MWKLDDLRVMEQRVSRLDEQWISQCDVGKLMLLECGEEEKKRRRERKKRRRDTIDVNNAGCTFHRPRGKELIKSSLAARR